MFCEGPVRKHFPSGFEYVRLYKHRRVILNCARQLKDNNFLREYGHIDFIAKEVIYHKICRARYINKGAKIQGKENSLPYTKRRESAFLRLLDSELLV